MHRLLAFLAVFALAACDGSRVLVPVEPPVGPVLPPPIDPPPPVDPPPPPGPVDPPPANVAALLERIELGSTLAAVTAVIGAPPVSIPAGAGPDTARWYVREGNAQFLVWVVFEAGRATRKGSTRVGEFP